MPTKSTILLIGAPALAGPFKAAGLVVLVGDPPPAGSYVTVVGQLDATTTSVVQKQVAEGRQVVILAAPGSQASSQPPPNVHVMRLPVQIDALLVEIGAQEVGGTVGTAEIGLDYAARPTRARDGLGLFKAPGHTGQDGSGPAARGPAPLDIDEIEARRAQSVVKAPPQWDLSGIDGGGAVAVADQPQPDDPMSVYDQPLPSQADEEGETSQEPAPTFSVPPLPKPPPAPGKPAFPGPGPAGVYRSPASQKTGELLICFAGKGGVGKSSMAIALGEQASALGLRTIVVDANRGQGDLRKYLRVNQAYLPSVVDAATSGDPSRAITTPERLAAARPADMPVPSFSAVLAPNDAQMDPSLVTPVLYREVVDAMRSIADLVVVDTQIVEATDVGGMVDDFLVPELVSGAWGLGISDPSVGVDNLLRRLYMFAAKGVRPDRIMVCLNRVEPTSGLNQEAFAKLAGPYATMMGAIGIDPRIVTAFESGGAPTSPALDELLGRVLERVTGISPVVRAKPSPANEKGAKRWIFGRKK